MNCTCKSTVDGHPGKGPHHLYGCPLHATSYENPPAELMDEQEQVPQAAIYKVATRQCERAASWGHHEPWDEVHPATRDSYIASAREDLEAAYPAIKEETLREVEEALRSDEAATAAWHIGRSAIEDGDRDKPFPRWRGMVRAALAILKDQDHVDEEACERWAVGQILRHPNGGEWKLTKHLGGDEDDWLAECVRFEPPAPGRTSSPRMFHREYMDRTFTVVAQPDCNPDSSERKEER